MLPNEIKYFQVAYILNVQVAREELNKLLSSHKLPNKLIFEKHYVEFEISLLRRVCKGTKNFLYINKKAPDNRGLVTFIQFFTRYFLKRNIIVEVVIIRRWRHRALRGRLLGLCRS